MTGSESKQFVPDQECSAKQILDKLVNHLCLAPDWFLQDVLYIDRNACSGCLVIAWSRLVSCEVMVSSLDGGLPLRADIHAASSELKCPTLFRTCRQGNKYNPRKVNPENTGYTLITEPATLIKPCED